LAHSKVIRIQSTGFMEFSNSKALCCVALPKYSDSAAAGPKGYKIVQNFVL